MVWNNNYIIVCSDSLVDKKDQGEEVSEIN